MASPVPVIVAKTPAPIELPDRQAMWRGARSWSAALIVAAFPFLFIIDRAVDPPLSPVLPGLVALLVLIVTLPFGVNEIALRRERRRESQKRTERVHKFRQAGRTALIVSLVWFAGWLAWGA